VVMRPNPDGPHDRDVDTLWLEDARAGTTVASLTVAACHPTCRGGQQVGGDYPGYLMRELEGAVGGVALFVLGCAGDVRPRFTNPAGGFRMAEPAEVEEAGRKMARAVLERRESRARPAVWELEARRLVEPVPLAEAPADPEFREIAASDPSPLRREWARRMLERGAAGRPRAVPFEMQALRLKPGYTLLFWPGEVAAEYALWLKGEFEQPGEQWVTAAAYANGAVGYVPGEKMYPLGGYEVNGSHFYYNLPAPYAPDVERRLRAATHNLLNETP
jgi:hypothetical protein